MSLAPADRRAPRVVLVSTYDLGRQPFGVASAAAWLAREGAEVVCLDLAVEALDEERLRGADWIAFHLPMHTATRLAARHLPRARALAPDARVCCFGLYAAMNGPYLAGLGADHVLGGEFEADLAALVRGEPRPAARVAHERLSFLVPDRTGLPELSRYARLVLPGGGSLVAGATEASRGCKHRCRHCPVVPVYDGRFRIVQRDVVLEDVRRQVEAGARHITFGDPDFWNGIGHALPIVEQLHREHPEVGYDVTIKIEHLLRHRDHLATLARTGCRFVTSAVESLDDRVLALLEKGHTRADFLRALELCREAGLTLQPTFIPFTPWTTLDGYRELIETLDRLDLVEQVAPIQLAIRLLVPAGSRLLELPEVATLVGPFDPAALVHPWRHPRPEVDALQARVHALVQEAAARGEPRPLVFDRIAGLASGGRAAPAPAAARRRGAPIPYLTEPWYC